MNVHGSNLVVHPAHSLQRRIVITQLKLTTRHVLLLKDGHARLPVVLCKKRREKNGLESHPALILVPYHVVRVKPTAQQMGLKEIILSMR